jgi:hypothetical protein
MRLTNVSSDDRAATHHQAKTGGNRHGLPWMAANVGFGGVDRGLVRSRTLDTESSACLSFRAICPRRVSASSPTSEALLLSSLSDSSISA